MLGKILGEDLKRNLIEMATQTEHRIETQIEQLIDKDVQKKISQLNHEGVQQMIEIQEKEHQKMKDKVNQYTVNLINEDFLKQE